MDWIPGVSQFKSMLQLIDGDVEGAAKTQENFIRGCPVVSQITSTCQLMTGDKKGALETQKRCSEAINHIPVVGHVKGAIHHAVGDHEGASQAITAANRSTTRIF